jgi:hypothetical protein
MTSRLRIGALLAFAFAAGCGFPEPPPNAPDPVTPPSPPALLAMYPPAESTVVYDTAIWGEFRVALDPATITEQNIYLKRDSQRIPVTLSWDAGTRRLSLSPRGVLALRATHTIEITSRVRDVLGQSPGDPLFWQFRTNSLRYPDPFPPSRPDVPASPLSAILWRTTESSAGAIRYAIYLSEDSSAAHSHAVSPLDGPANGYLIPTARWRAGARIWYAVQATNLSTGERLSGAARPFDVLPASTPVDSIVVPASEWGWSLNFSNRNTCNERTLYVSPSRTLNGIRWALPRPGEGVRLAGARLFLGGSFSGTLQQVSPRLFSTARDWSACRINKLESPGLLRLLATGRESPGAPLFESDDFTAHLEASTRYSGFYGYSFESSRDITFDLGAPSLSGRGGLTLYLYRVAPGPAAAIP